MRNFEIALAVAGLLAVTAAACGAGDTSDSDVLGVPEEFIARRAKYDVTRPFEELVKPHFFAISEKGEFVRAKGRPERIVERDGRLQILLEQVGEALYVDLLALESELLGEHPVHKVFRLIDMGIPIEDGLVARLEPSRFDHGLFRSLDFDYLPGKKAGGVIAEVFSDGTFLVVPHEVPPEWRSDESDLATPSHFHVDPRALSAGDSILAKEFEEEILALPFEEQRYPVAALAKRQCSVYQQSRRDNRYGGVLSSIGFRHDPAPFLQDTDAGSSIFGEGLSSLLLRSSGDGVLYFGYEGYWVGDVLAAMEVPWIDECETAGGVRRYRKPGESQDSYYATVRRSLEPNKKLRYNILRLADDGSSEVVYTAPGVILMASPLPFEGPWWIMSTEGWQAPEEGIPGDPRWQSVYVVNVDDPDEFYPVEYPVSTYPEAPEWGSLYGASAALSPDGAFLHNLLYGFTDEGGGLWVADLSRPDFYSNPEAFSRIAAWDHPLSWIDLSSETDGPDSIMSLFLTGKEVADDFAMTGNFLRIRDAGLGSTVEVRERLIRMIGWNPVPFVLQRLTEQSVTVGVEAYFNYESSLLPRAKGVYLVPVDTGAFK